MKEARRLPKAFVVSSLNSLFFTYLQSIPVSILKIMFTTQLEMTGMITGSIRQMLLQLMI